MLRSQEHGSRHPPKKHGQEAPPYTLFSGSPSQKCSLQREIFFFFLIKIGGKKNHWRVEEPLEFLF